MIEWQWDPLSPTGKKIKCTPCYCRPEASLYWKSGWLAKTTMWWVIGIEECFIEPKSWEVPGLQGRAVPWNLKGRGTLCVSPKLFSLHLLYSLPADWLSLLLKTTWWNMATLNLHLVVPVKGHTGLALLAPIPNSWEKRSYWLIFLVIPVLVQWAMTSGYAHAVEMWAEDPPAP